MRSQSPSLIAPHQRAGHCLPRYCSSAKATGRSVQVASTAGIVVDTVWAAPDDLTYTSEPVKLCAVTGGSLHFPRRVRRRLRCLRKGHRYQPHEQHHGDVIIVTDRCERCGHSIVRGIREWPGRHAGAQGDTGPAASADPP